MKLLFFLSAVALAAEETTTAVDETTLPAHNPEAQDFCHNACRGTDLGLPNGNCMDGFYANPDDCSSYFVCWDQGKTGDKFVCASGLVWNQKLLMCDWAYNLEEDDKCYVCHQC